MNAELGTILSSQLRVPIYDRTNQTMAHWPIRFIRNSHLLSSTSDAVRWDRRTPQWLHTGVQRCLSRWICKLLMVDDDGDQQIVFHIHRLKAVCQIYQKICPFVGILWIKYTKYSQKRQIFSVKLDKSFFYVQVEVTAAISVAVSWNPTDWSYIIRIDDRVASWRAINRKGSDVLSTTIFDVPKRKRKRSPAIPSVWGWMKMSASGDRHPGMIERTFNRCWHFYVIDWTYRALSTSEYLRIPWICRRQIRIVAVHRR